MKHGWNTTSWLDYCICTADAHDCLEKLKILYDLATRDHIPVFMLNVESLPELSNYDNHENRGKFDWARLTANDLCQYKVSTEKSLSNIAVPTETIMCDNVNSKNP